MAQNGRQDKGTTQRMSTSAFKSLHDRVENITFDPKLWRRGFGWVCTAGFARKGSRKPNNLKLCSAEQIDKKKAELTLGLQFRCAPSHFATAWWAGVVGKLPWKDQSTVQPQRELGAIATGHEKPSERCERRTCGGTIKENFFLGRQCCAEEAPSFLQSRYASTAYLQLHTCHWSHVSFQCVCGWCSCLACYSVNFF